MRALIVVAVALLLPAGALAQSGGHIGLHPMVETLSTCGIYETVGTVNSVLVVHETAVEGNTARFMVQNNWTNAIPVGEEYFGNLYLGDIFTGVTITYVGCKALPHTLARLDFIPFSSTPPCLEGLRVVPDPGVAHGQIEVVDCSYNIVFATGGVAFINGGHFDPDLPCRCDIATEEQTWGRMKALYR